VIGCKQEGLLFLAGFYGWFIAPFLVGVAWATIAAALFASRARGLPAYRLAGLGCLVAVIVVFLGWMTRYPDQVPGMWRFITSVDPFEGW